jgi:predicted Zn-dependent protease
LLKDQKEATAWQETAAELRRKENILAALDRALVSDPDAFWSRATRAHYLASEGNWGQAELIVAQLVTQQPGDPFIIELADAVRRRTKLPDLSRIPIVQH